MTDARKLLARLNPGSIQYGVSRGGIPELTPQDIAGALGFIRDAFDRELFCALWWPDGSRLNRGEFDLMLRNRQMGEYLRRQRALVVARLAVDVAQDEVEGTHGGIHNVKRALSHARAELDEAKARAWPAWQRPTKAGQTPEASRYSAIRKAVLEEIAEPRRCKTCGGRGHVRKDSLVIGCTSCAGTGQWPHSERRRAETIGLAHQVFPRWSGVYEWTYRLCKSADTRANKLMKDNLEMASC